MCAPKPLVIVLEDDTASAEALSYLLRDWGADVFLTDRAEPALGRVKASQSQPVLIIADFDLGEGHDGVTISRQLCVQAPHARVLVLSGTFHGGAARSAASAGFEMLQKPARADAIIAWLERA